MLHVVTHDSIGERERCELGRDSQRITPKYKIYPASDFVNN